MDRPLEGNAELLKTLAKLFYEPWHPRGTYRVDSEETIYRNFVITTAYIFLVLLLAFVPMDLALGVTPWPMIVIIAAGAGVLASVRLFSSHLVPAYLFLFVALAALIAMLLVFRDFPFTILFWVPAYAIWCVFLIGKKRGTLLSLVALSLTSIVVLSPATMSIASFHVPAMSTRVIAVITLAVVTTAALSTCWAFVWFLDTLRQEARRRKEFLAVLSHELRNPLTPIQNSLQILDHATPGGEQARRARAVIGRQLGQLVRLVNDLLDTTRLSNRKIRLQLERVDLDELVRDTFEDHRSEFEQAEVQPELLRGPGPVWVMGDRSRLAQIIGNLLQNSAKFTGRGGRAMISVSEDRAAKRAVLRVADTGVGMSPELLARLFEPLVQAEQALDRSRGGLGLGLVLVKGLVELHGGEIHARSPGPGQGSEFEVRLPLAPVAEREREREAPKPESAKARVLIIEDNADAATTLREVLEMLGHEVSVAYDGIAGVAKARACSPDVILSDIGLPGLDGYQVARTLRADPAFAGVRMIAVSGYALPADVSQSLEAGFDEHLAKPIDLGRLNALLDGAKNRV